MNSPSSALSSTTFTSLSSSGSEKFQGMIKDTSYKAFRKSLTQLFDYIGQIAPQYRQLHSVVSVLRIIQLYAITLCPNINNLWGAHSICSKFLNIVSIFFFIMPVQFRDEYGQIFLNVSSAVLLIIFVVISVSALYFKKTAKLQAWIPKFITIMVGSVGYLVLTADSSVIAQFLSDMVARPKQFVNPLNVITIIINTFFVLTFIWLFATIYSISVTFKPDSLMCVVPVTSTLLGCTPILFAFILSLAFHMNYIAQAVIFFVLGFAFLGGTLLLSYKGGLVSINHIRYLDAVFMSGGLNLFTNGAVLLIQVYPMEILFIVYAVLFFAGLALTNLVIMKKAGTRLNLLDALEIDNETWAQVKTPSLVCELAVSGFRYAHPYCTSWQIFKTAIEYFPTSGDIWFIFGKFTAVYPEASAQLLLVSMGIINNKIHGVLAKSMLTQIASIMKQREVNFIPELKRRLDLLSKQVQATKHKMRYIWDLVIQGKTKDLEGVLANAYNAVDSTEAEFKHLLCMFPNSRFVARAYARFLRDVIGDHAEHKKWADKISLLQRGISVVPDLSHELGLYAFPLLPNRIGTMQVGGEAMVSTDADTLTIELDDDEQASMDAELKMSVRESINKLRIPSFHRARLGRFLVSFILFFCPVVALSIYIPISVDQSIAPLDYLNKVSELRSYALQLIGTSHHLCGESIAVNPGSSPPTYPLLPPMSLAEADNEKLQFTDTKTNIKELMNDLYPAVSVISPLYNYRSDDPKMTNVRNLLFEPTTTIKLLNNAHVVSTGKTSLITFVTQLIILVNDLMQMPAIDPTTVFQSPSMYIPLTNANTMVIGFNNVMYQLIEVINQKHSETNQLMNYIIIAVCCLCVVFYSTLCFGMLKFIAKDKLIIYTCLSSLPKNVVSHVCDSLKVLKKEDDGDDHLLIASSGGGSSSQEEDVNRHEENMLKIFATSTTQSGIKNSDAVFAYLFTVAILALHIGCTFYLCDFLKDADLTAANAAPHIHFITAAFLYDYMGVIVLNRIAIGSNGPAYVSGDRDDVSNVDAFFQYSKNASIFYNLVRYGDRTKGILPFASLGQEFLIHGDVDSKCPPSGTRVPATFHQSYACEPGDTLVGWCKIWCRNIALKVILTRNDGANRFIFRTNDGDTPTDTSRNTLQQIWHVQSHHLYDQYYEPMFKKIIPLVKTAIEDKVSSIVGGGWAMLCVAIVLEAMFIYTLSQSEQRQKFALRLLLHVPGSVVLSNQHITALLSGNFNVKNFDAQTRTAEFYDDLVDELPNGIFVLDINGVIQKVNKAALRIFGVESDSIIGTSMGEFGKCFQPENPFADISNITPMPFDKVLSTMRGEDEVHTEVSFTQFQDNLVVTVSDITQIVRYNKLISEERERSDQLLASILPAHLVSRVQAGEKNISFAVQTVTVSFIDVVEFTPWCGSNSADHVMSTLNKIFKAFDTSVAQHPTMTKIKCIGDCYMSAGGIFADVSQSSVHAKEVVEFGLESIEAVRTVNAEIGESLRIRVGVNTGGPIVAGVLGTEKPTFEILGPTINMAQQMEHHGIAMKVHVSRAVYELIYGGAFVVKERGEIQVKKGKVVTYVVEKKNENAK